MSSWLFIFGRTHELSFHELVALVRNPVTSIIPGVARVEDPREEIIPEELINKLGGTIKIAREKGRIQTITCEDIRQLLHTEGKQVTFGISIYGGVGRVDSELLRGVKGAFASRGIHARYVVPQKDNTLSSVVIKKQHVRELIFVAAGEGFIAGETVIVQDFEAWNKRDYGRPFADPKAGMLPPKVARMAVNIGMPNAKCQMLNEKPILLDPFCGMGTILGEGLLTGWKVIGSDQSEEVVEKARKNLEWLNRAGVTQFFVCDATHVSEHVSLHSIDAIVTEPFLGEARRIMNQESREIKNIIKGLEKLYIGCLREWHQVLKPGGKVVIALPQYAIGNKTFFVKNVIDRCENLGYTVSLGPLDYGREHAIVRRKFYVLKSINQ